MWVSPIVITEFGMVMARLAHCDDGAGNGLGSSRWWDGVVSLVPVSGEGIDPQWIGAQRGSGP